MKDYIDDMKESAKKAMKKYCRKTRLMVIAHYGGKCECCGETTIQFLGIDHINGDGAEHRRKIGKGPIYFWLKRNNYPPGFRVLCHNCNLSIGFYGYCPHKEFKLAPEVRRDPIPKGFF